jgi:hypothetical protein
MSKSGVMEKTTRGLSLAALEILVLSAVLFHGAQCQGSQAGAGAGAANLTVVGTVFCDACSSSSFSNHSYFLSGIHFILHPIYTRTSVLSCFDLPCY